MQAQQKALNHPRESLGDLLGELAKQSSELVRGEVALAKAEVREKLRAAGSAACFAVSGAALGLLASMALLAAGIIALAGYVGFIAASLIFGAVLGVPAILLVLRGVDHFKRLSSG